MCVRMHAACVRAGGRAGGRACACVRACVRGGIVGVRAWRAGVRECVQACVIVYFFDTSGQRN